MTHTISEVHAEVARLRMVVAVDSAMMLSILRRMTADELAISSQDFLQVCEGLNIRTLFSELDDASVQSAQSRRDWWIGLLAELVAENAGLASDVHQMGAHMP